MDTLSTTATDSTPLAQRLALADEGSTRVDGWTPARMAAFVDALAATGCVETACSHLGMAKSGLYEARRRNPLFALAWEDALIEGALPRLADELLSHAFKGSVERYYRDGEMVGEKHFTDTRLGLALLKRLDRKAAERAQADKAAEDAAALQAVYDARRAAAYDPFEDEQVDEVDDQPFVPTLDRPHPRIMHTARGWQTSFPPPLHRDEADDWVLLGYDPDSGEDPDDYRHDPLAVEDLAEGDRWPGSPGYIRYCTAAERTALNRWVQRQLAPAHAEHDQFFGHLAAPGEGDPAHA